MSWSAPPTVTVGSAATSTFANLLGADLTDLDSRTNLVTASVLTSQTTTSTTYTDLGTTGPAVTLTTGTSAVVVITAEVDTTGAGVSPYMGFAVSGATTVAAADSMAIRVDSSAIVNVCVSNVFLVTGLTGGSNTFTMKYRVGGGTGTYVNRRITVWPGNKIS